MDRKLAMKRFLLNLSSLVLVLIIFQVGSYYLLGKESIWVNYYQHCKPLVIGIENCNVITKSELTDLQINKIKQSLSSEFKLVSLSNDTSYLPAPIRQRSRCNQFICRL